MHETSAPGRPGLQGECDFTQKLGQGALYGRPLGGLCPLAMVQGHGHAVDHIHAAGLPLCSAVAGELPTVKGHLLPICWMSEKTPD